MDTQRLVDEAAGDVDRSLLEGTGSGGMLSVGYFADGALVERLREGEGVDYALQNLTKGLKVERDSQRDKADPAANFRSALLVTDDRLLYVVGQDEGDETFSVPFSRVHDVDTSTGMFKDRITVYTDAETYDMYVQKASEVEETAEHIVSAAEVGRAGRRTECDGESTPKSMSIIKDEAGERDDTSSESGTVGSSEESDHGSPRDGEPSEKVRVDSRNSDDEFIQEGPDNVEPSSGEGAAETEPDIESTSIETESNTDKPGVSDDTIESGTDVATESSANVEVLVSDEDGQPVSDARVTVAGTTFEVDRRTTQTGRCHLELPPRVETVNVVVEHDKHGMLRENISAVNGSVVDVTLGEAGEGKNQTGNADGIAADREATEDADDVGSDSTASREELLEALIALNEFSSRKVTRGRMRSKGLYKPEDYEAEFGTWSAALEAAMLHEEDPEPSSAPQQQEPYTKEEVLDAIRDVAKTVGGQPATAEMQEHGRMSVGPAYRFFDSWGDAVSAAFEPNEIAVDEGVVGDDIGAASGRTAEADAAPDQDMNTDVDERMDTDTDTDEVVGLASRPADKDPLADNLEAAPTGRLSDVVVEVHEVHEVTPEKRAAEYEVKTAAGDLVEFVVWETHGLDFDAEPRTRLCIDDIRLARWETDDGPSHQLDSTADLEASVVGEGESTDDAREESACGETTTSAVERFVGVGGATESDAEALVNAGYTTIEDLKSATIEELRSTSDLNDGTALRIKAELG